MNEIALLKVFLLKSMIMKTYISFTLILLLAACSTIEIRESDAFDAHQTVTPNNFQFEQYTLHSISLETEDGEKLDSWFLEHENPAATVLYFGGNGFLMLKSKPLIQAYSNIPVNLMLFDYRGYGLSSGQPTVAGIQKDAKAAFDFARNQTISSTDKLFIHGHSMGSFLSASTAYEQEISGYVMESPITEVTDWTRNLVPRLLRPFIRFDIDDALANESNLGKVSQINTPLLLISGSSDEITPSSMAEKLEKNSASEEKTLVIIEGGNHNNLPTFQQYRNALISFYGLSD